jgi:hypothetical protein
LEFLQLVLSFHRQGMAGAGTGSHC